MNAIDDPPSACARAVDERRRALGRRGEQLAAAHLRRTGYEEIARNVRTRRGEIDLIVRDERALVFVEVKTRTIGDAQRTPRPDQQPLAGLGTGQRARLRRLAAAWLAEERSRPFAASIRFDAVGVVLDASGRLRGIEHLENAW
ncbi:MAG TPA: YraN family protein [Solirubrobacteraceae bacterium]|nr:YraN family protein [Solirubrobacteraceae bacterium]